MAYVFNPFTQELDFVGQNAGLINFRGSFSDSNTQLVQYTTAGQAITMDTVELADGVTLSNGSRMVLPILGTIFSDSVQLGFTYRGTVIEVP